jgi:predicted metal-dependent hydrolase
MNIAGMTAEKSYLNRRKALGITVRRLEFNPRYQTHYFANSPLMSHFLTALFNISVGEQFL